MAAAVGGRVGGRTQVKNVEGNREVQELGRYCVQEYNRQQQQNRLLVFSRVVEAQTQIVSGIKYYLNISARAGGEPQSFEAVAVVKPWLHSKQLLNFGPSSSPRNTK
ncbi:cysteine proteinase inhibitor 5 [Phtheirospermum japonicum]|uniref:Cysteine proteinase inhibitor 5 n=1 Tax=Phtheirospermum japonicum TaxID=374723 RepID=A0A830CXR9_9LAMI|nr:cysteine proteinase inhibitor 5 [Phtheirospermum japonicum]